MSVTLLLKIMSISVKDKDALTADFTSTGDFNVWNPGVLATESSIPTSASGTIYYVKNYNGQGPKYVYSNNSQDIV